MASQGLFTQGITVDDLLKQRRVRSQANQQQMMNDAAQGARDPQRARMGSMFGSIIGKALGDNAGGADSEMEKLKASNAQKQQFQGSYGELMSSGTPEQLKQGAQAFYKAGYITEAGDLNNAANVGFKAQKEQRQNALDQTIEQDDNLSLADSVREDNGPLAKMVEAGNAQAIKLALKINSPENEATVVKQGAYKLANGTLVSGYVKGTARFIYGPNNEPQPMPPAALWVGEGTGETLTREQQNLATFMDNKTRLANAVSKNELSQQEADSQLHNIKSALSIAIDPSVKAQATIDAQNSGAYLTSVSDASVGAGEAIASYNQSLGFLNEGMYTGTGAGALQAIKKLAIATGLADKGTEIDAANVEMFRANIMDAVLKRVQATRGSISEMEMKGFAQASIGLDKTVAGNRLLLETGIKSEQWIKDRSSAINDWYGEQRKKGLRPLRSEIKTFASSWEDQNKLVLPTIEQINAAKSEGNVFVTDGSSILDGLSSSELIDAANAL